MRYIFGIWTAFVALMVSAVAAYYSIIGLTVIFAAAFIPIIIMGSVLEVAKITTAVWLHSFWYEAPILTKVYLTSAVVILMLITSMGIFGFLSKAHIEQSASGSEVVARIDRVEQEIGRHEQAIERANLTIKGFDSRIEIVDTSILGRIETQERIINDISTRLQIDISVQNQTINQEFAILAPLRDELNRIREQREELSIAQSEGNVRSLQVIVGTKTDGILGPNTRLRMAQYTTRLDDRQVKILLDLKRLQTTDNLIVNQARIEITRLQQTANKTIGQAQDAINAFRNQLVQVTTIDNTIAIKGQTQIIDDANIKINILFTQKFELEGTLRAIEIEVGPVKYIAELLYGDANEDLLEEAVRWVIIILVLVFDPLAIVLVISGLSLIYSKDPLDNTPENPYNSMDPKGTDPKGPPTSLPVTTNKEQAEQPAAALQTPASDVQNIKSTLDTTQMRVDTGPTEKKINPLIVGTPRSRIMTTKR